MNSATISETRQYLTFRLADEIFGLDVAEVREILDVPDITTVPRMPDYMCGVINLRGSVVPVVDMRLKFGMPKAEKTVESCIVVVEMTIDELPAVIGALVDGVREVFELDPSQIEPAPKIGMSLKTEYIRGMGKQNDDFIIILNMDRIFSAEEMDMVRSATADESELITAAG